MVDEPAGVTVKLKSENTLLIFGHPPHLFAQSIVQNATYFHLNQIETKHNKRTAWDVLLVSLQSLFRFRCLLFSTILCGWYGSFFGTISIISPWLGSQIYCINITQGLGQSSLVIFINMGSCHPGRGLIPSQGRVLGAVHAEEQCMIWSIPSIPTVTTSFWNYTKHPTIVKSTMTPKCHVGRILLIVCLSARFWWNVTVENGVNFITSVPDNKNHLCWREIGHLRCCCVGYWGGFSFLS